MNPALESLIAHFRAAQDLGVATLTQKLLIPSPATDRDWPFICIEYKINRRCDRDGVGIYSHGYGIELKIEDLTIDFDWGNEGEADGFDAWRLYNFTIDNRDCLSCTHSGVQQWLDEAVAAGEITKSGNLYYDPKRRTSGISTLAAS